MVRKRAGGASKTTELLCAQRRTPWPGSCEARESYCQHVVGSPLQALQVQLAQLPVRARARHQHQEQRQRARGEVTTGGSAAGVGAGSDAGEVWSFRQLVHNVMRAHAQEDGVSVVLRSSAAALAQQRIERSYRIAGGPLQACWGV